jgi:RNA polymerase sigma factor for flagellar operon FliA
MNKTGIPSNKDQCLREYSHLVKRLAFQMMTRLPHSVQIDDIIQDGMMGLLDAASRYREFHGARFETYATQRIRGAMLDELREADWMPRWVRSDMRRIETAINRLQQKLGRPPNESEIAGEMKLSLAEYQQFLHKSRGAQLVYYEDIRGEGNDDFFERFGSGGGNPLDLLEDLCFKAELARGIDSLPERERVLMGMLYEQEMGLRAIGEVLGVRESRVSQLHSQAIARLRSWMRGY